jgi:glucose/arabinose dehydrogenase
MKLWFKIVLGLGALGALLAASIYWYLSTRDSREPSFVAWNKHCASCHGQALEGTNLGSALVEAKLKHGDTVEKIMAVIATGVPNTTMTAWDHKLSPELIKGLALFISEHRQKFPTTTKSYTLEPQTSRNIRSTHHDFRLERVATLESRPYSLAYMPNGEILIAEKTRGLSLVDLKGKQGALIKDTPQVWGTLLSVGGSWVNLGIVLDVELHPDYEENGWIYLSHTDRCLTSCGWVVPGTMVRVVRGRIKDGQWMDQEVIWSVHKDHYTPVPDGVAAGRLAFDGRGHLYISIGGKNTYDKLHQLDTPFGKIHRVRDDGTVPEDNPFWVAPSERLEASTIQTVWSYGHRTGQGLDAHPNTGELWNTEMGPRGGDEINNILAGQNYGWPLYTNGLDYNGEEVSIGRDLGLDFPIEDTILPVVDFTPAPAVSNFTFHDGIKFPGWRNDLLVGSLKASTLYRLRIEDNRLVEQEKLITDFGRIRDVEMGDDGFVYIVIEHNEAGSLWRLVPDTGH